VPTPVPNPGALAARLLRLLMKKNKKTAHAITAMPPTAPPTAPPITAELDLLLELSLPLEEPGDGLGSAKNGVELEVEVGVVKESNEVVVGAAPPKVVDPTREVARAVKRYLVEAHPYWVHVPVASKYMIEPQTGAVATLSRRN